MPDDSVFTFADDEEREICAFLRDPASYGAGAAGVDVVETHIARVFLVGEDAYKLRKRVHLRFVNFSTLHARHAAAVREMEINRPHAPHIYLGLVPIMRNEGSFPSAAAARSSNGRCTCAASLRRPCSATVRSRGRSPTILPSSLADMVARYHQDSPVCRRPATAPRILAPVVEQLSAALAYGHAEVAERLVAAFERAKPLLIERGNAGCVRRCHGDLHLGNIVLIDNVPVPFDALEFSEALATIDVLYDLAFLLMDLDARGDRQAANAVLNAYVAVRAHRRRDRGPGLPAAVPRLPRRRARRGGDGAHRAAAAEEQTSSCAPRSAATPGSPPPIWRRRRPC